MLLYKFTPQLTVKKNINNNFVINAQKVRYMVNYHTKIKGFTFSNVEMTLCKSFVIPVISQNATEWH